MFEKGIVKAILLSRIFLGTMLKIGLQGLLLVGIQAGIDVFNVGRIGEIKGDAANIF